MCTGLGSNNKEEYKLAKANVRTLEHDFMVLTKICSSVAKLHHDYQVSVPELSLSSWVKSPPPSPVVFPTAPACAGSKYIVLWSHVNGLSYYLVTAVWLSTHYIQLHQLDFKGYLYHTVKAYIAGVFMYSCL